MGFFLEILVLQHMICTLNVIAFPQRSTVFSYDEIETYANDDIEANEITESSIILTWIYFMYF